MSSVCAYFTAAVPILLVFLGASVSNGNPSLVLAPTLVLLDNRNTYCPGETAHIRCNITGSGNGSGVVYDWIIDHIDYSPTTIASRIPGHTVSSSDRFVLQVHQIRAYTANYSCIVRVAGRAPQSRAHYKLIAFAEKTFPALTATCANATSNSVTVLMKEISKCSLAKVYVTTGSTNCSATGLNLYLCAGLQPKTTYTISAVTTTRSANGSVLKTTLGTTVCTTGALKGAVNDKSEGCNGAVAAAWTLAAMEVITLASTGHIVVVIIVIIYRLKKKLRSQEATVAVTNINVTTKEGAKAVINIPVTNCNCMEEDVTDSSKKEREPTSGVAYAELDFAARRDLPIKPPPAFERVKYADVPVH